MARDRCRVRVHSFVDYGRILRYVSAHEARLMCGESPAGEPLDDIEPIAKRISRRKAKLEDIRLLSPERVKRNDCATLTMGDTINNAIGSHGRLSEHDSIRVIDRALAKVQAWATTHDDRAVIISAGMVFQPA